MIKKDKIILFVCVAFVSLIFSQENLGIIKYTGIINKKHVDSFLLELETKKNVPMHVKQEVVRMYNYATPEVFELNFKNGESYYYFVPVLDEGDYNVGSKAGRTPYYTNNKTDTIIEMTPSLGNIYIKPLNWKITQETKQVGEYQCYKAITTERLYSRQGHYYNETIVAWFTPEIPLNFGPKSYKGLPGLILEVETPIYTMTATRINLHPDEKDVKIKRIGENEKVITEEESHARIKEMMDSRKK